ncbi:MAG: hypothetical protein ACYCTL_08755 [Acidimicrobiales bacterium]
MSVECLPASLVWGEEVHLVTRVAALDRLDPAGIGYSGLVVQ